MSYKPQALGCLVATGLVVLPLLPAGFANPPYQPTLSRSPLPQYSCCAPARQAYSHSASLGRRYFFPVLALSASINAWASSQLTCSTGQLSPQLPNLLGLLPMSAFHWPCVTSVLPIAKVRLMVTWCTGISLGSPLFEPMSKLPPGITTISGQSAQSLNILPAAMLVPPFSFTTGLRSSLA